jgi:hypothetical protein
MRALVFDLERHTPAHLRSYVLSELVSSGLSDICLKYMALRPSTANVPQFSIDINFAIAVGESLRRSIARPVSLAAPAFGIHSDAIAEGLKLAHGIASLRFLLALVTAPIRTLVTALSSKTLPVGGPGERLTPDSSVLESCSAIEVAETLVTAPFDPTIEYALVGSKPFSELALDCMTHIWEEILATPMEPSWSTQRIVDVISNRPELAETRSTAEEWTAQLEEVLQALHVAHC